AVRAEPRRANRAPTAFAVGHREPARDRPPRRPRGRAPRPLGSAGARTLESRRSIADPQGQLQDAAHQDRRVRADGARAAPLLSITAPGPSATDRLDKARAGP